MGNFFHIYLYLVLVVLLALYQAQVAAVFHSVEVLVLHAAQGGGSVPTMQV